MKILVTVVLLSGAMFAQTHTFPALDTNNTFTGSNSFTNTHSLSQLVPLQWGSNGLLVPDTGLSRTAGGTLAVGNGTQGLASGSFRPTNNQVTSSGQLAGLSSNGVAGVVAVGTRSL